MSFIEGSWAGELSPERGLVEGLVHQETLGHWRLQGLKNVSASGYSPHLPVKNPGGVHSLGRRHWVTWGTLARCGKTKGRNWQQEVICGLWSPN